MSDFRIRIPVEEFVALRGLGEWCMGAFVEARCSTKNEDVRLVWDAVESLCAEVNALCAGDRSHE